jgi:hypothetical protein
VLVDKRLHRFNGMKDGVGAAKCCKGASDEPGNAPQDDQTASVLRRKQPFDFAQMVPLGRKVMLSEILDLGRSTYSEYPSVNPDGAGLSSMVGAQFP